MFFRGLIFICVFALSAFLLGNAFLVLINWKRSISASYVWGLLILFSLFQITAYPLYRIGTSFVFLVWLFGIILLSGIIFSIYIFLKDCSVSYYRASIKNGLHSARNNTGITVALLLALLLYCFFSLGFYYSTSDDGYYVTRSLEAISQNILQFSEQFAWYGWENDYAFDYRDCTTTLSFFVAFLSVLSGIQCTVLNKTFFAFLLILAHFSAVSYAYDTFIKTDPKKHYLKKALFFILYILFQMLCVKESSAGTWVTGYIWVGKAMLIAIVFPMLLATCGILFERMEFFRQREWITVTVVLLSGIAVSIVGINLPVILYFIFGLSILISCRFKYINKLWKPVIISALPVVLFIILCYLGVTNGTVLEDRTGILSDSVNAGTQSHIVLPRIETVKQLFSAWMVQFWQAIDFWQFALYALSLLWFVIKGTKKQRTFFVLSSVILFLTFLNPLFIDIVSKYVTTSIVYWRLFWILPVYFVPAMAISDIFLILLEDRLEKGLLCIGMALCVIAGFEVFRYSVTSAEYSIVPFAKNIGKLFNVRPELRFGLYNLNIGSTETAQLILDDWDGDSRPMVLMCYDRPFELRMYSEEIALAAPVRDYIKGNASGKIPGTDLMKGDFFVSYETITDADVLKDLLSRLNVDYVCFSQKPAIDGLENHGFSFIGNVYEAEIWRVLYE